MASCQWLLLNHILREKSSIARGPALLLNMICRRVGIQVEILIRGGLEETQYYFAVVPAEARAKEPYEIAFNMLNQDDVLSADEIQNGMAQRSLAVSQPYRMSSLFLVMLQVQFRDVDALIARNNNLLQRAFFQPSTSDPIEHVLALPLAWMMAHCNLGETSP
jgi:hypothetical protein|mmetsp:Transcript_1222/g.2253  ORF Transcript_1222/g.2253 Transcript_1222/m.2253 type:complete len:163 (-) Transcript_1222:59-547(-)